MIIHFNMYSMQIVFDYLLTYNLYITIFNNTLRIRDCDIIYKAKYTLKNT